MTGRNVYGFLSDCAAMGKFLAHVEEVKGGQQAVLTYVNTIERRIPTMTGEVVSPELSGNFQVTVALRGLDHLMELRKQCAIDRAKVGL